MPMKDMSPSGFVYLFQHCIYNKSILLDTDLGLLMAEVYSVRVYPLQSVL